MEIPVIQVDGRIECKYNILSVHGDFGPFAIEVANARLKLEIYEFVNGALLSFPDAPKVTTKVHSESPYFVIDFSPEVTPETRRAVFLHLVFETSKKQTSERMRVMERYDAEKRALAKKLESELDPTKRKLIEDLIEQLKFSIGTL